MKPKLHPLFLDASLNDHDLFTISANIYRHALVVAIKSHIYRQDLRRVTGLSINNERLLRDVRELSKYVERKVRALCKIPILHGSSLARKLVLRAFLEVWKSKSTSYHGAIVELEGSCNDEELGDLVDKGLCKRVLAMGMAFMEKAQF